MVKIRSLPKYSYIVSNADVEQPDVRACRMIPMWTHGQYFSTELIIMCGLNLENLGKNHGLLYINSWNVCPTCLGFSRLFTC
ncbi:hypothetical protein HanXRQr2_Chr02g0065491 [Helianthus annuus]|uniref:Uncharacterized protein n=1 Tax=Helianthus annuus TaxID=4232 RepID=A0A9K3JMI9_HELAN|nr:hypothetical protein HanXRQr2_Chr02g0065491 [Helianthus annuus]